MIKRFGGSHMTDKTSAMKAEAGPCCANMLITVILGAVIAASILIFLCLNAALALTFALVGILLVLRAVLILGLPERAPRAMIPRF